MRIRCYMKILTLNDVLETANDMISDKIITEKIGRLKST